MISLWVECERNDQPLGRVERIIKAGVHKGRTCYKVQLENQNQRPWVDATVVPEELRHKYHEKYTLRGTVRKEKGRKFVR